MSMQVTPLTGSTGAEVKGINLNRPMRKASMTIQVAPLTGSIGAEVKGINLNKPIDDDTFDELHKAFLDYCVLVFRDQDLEPEEHIEFGKRWVKIVQQNLLMKHAGGYP